MNLVELIILIVFVIFLKLYSDNEYPIIQPTNRDKNFGYNWLDI